MNNNTITAESLGERIRLSLGEEPKECLTIGQTSVPYNLDAGILAELLKGKTVRYENDNDSSVSKDKFRTFKIEVVENIFTAKRNGRRCVTGYMTDIDDGGRDKVRTLHLDGIRVIA